MDFYESDNFNAEQIAEEAAQLSRVLSLIREQIELLSSVPFEYRTVDIYDYNALVEQETERINYFARQKEIELLKRSLSTPFFAHMRLKPLGRKTADDDSPSYTRARRVTDSDGFLGEQADIYVGANVIVYRDKVIVFSHNSPLGNRVYDRFENGVIEYGGYEYKVIFRRKFDIRNGKLEAVFQDYSIEQGGVVYDRFLAHMLKVKRGDKRLTDIIPTIQANQNAAIILPADCNCAVSGCAGCGKTMLLMQRLEYLSFNKKMELENALVVAPSARYVEHIQPVVDDLMINAARRLTLAELYREILLSMRGIKSSARKAISSAELTGDEGLDDRTAIDCYGDAVKRRLISALGKTKRAYSEKLAEYRKAVELYEREPNWARSDFGEPRGKKPSPPAVAIDLNKFPFLPELGWCKAKLYLLLTAYIYVLGKPDFSATLFIDEGQDYFLNEYRLFAECTRAKVNVYGDVNQQLVEGRGLTSFADLDGLWQTEHRALNENYRNAREITEYVNELLGMNVTSLGLDGGIVRFSDVGDIMRDIAQAGDDRIAVIYSPTDVEMRDKLLGLGLSDGMLYTVAQSKGMEYERVYACGKMSDREKYVAYTRALNELVIVNLTA